MVHRLSTLPKPSSLPSNKRRADAGMTIVEMLIALAIGGVLMGALFSFIISTQGVISADTRRTNAGQTLRSALDLLSTDVRQAGEDMVVKISPIGISGTGMNKIVQIRRQVSGTVLPVCANVSSGASTIQVTWASSTPANGTGCPYSSDGGTNSLPITVRTWQALRLAAPNGVLRAFIYDPVAQTGEFFRYTGESMASAEIAVISKGSGFSRAYSVANKPFLVLLEEKQYFLSNTDLMLRLNGDSSTDQALAPDVTGLGATVDVDTSTTGTPNVVTAQTFGYGGAWKKITQVNLQLNGAVTERGRTTTRSLSDVVFPRNVLSR